MKKIELKNGENIILRKAVLEDAQFLYEKDFFESEFVLPHYSELNLMQEEKIQLLKQYMNNRHKVIIVACTKDEIIGWLTFDRSNFSQRQHQGHIAMTVKEKWRDVGVGTALLHEIIDWSKKEGTLKILYLTVLSHNERGIYLYEKIGFKITGRYPNYTKIHDIYVDDIIMSLFL